ncbi:hypothetical protein PHISCL_09207 [Aspergillus sclerotialis]|uniref:Uncharacterized protein n=1 Tax=Aspergillus sclerotialis TaxID=2070753 RepID=A0A3A2Z8B7_9EURO|nr:hypothetical protein PHISCL_09207 [Aspergillus sclerotialis]
MASNLDLSLPSHFPYISDFDHLDSTNSSFALYTLVELPQKKLHDLVTFLNEEMMKENDYDPDAPYLVRVPSVYNFAGKSLKDIVYIHIQMDKEIIPNSGGDCTGDLGWYPSAFIVVTNVEWEKYGLLFVYADKTGLYEFDSDENGEIKTNTVIAQQGLPMDQFFFKPRDPEYVFTILFNILSTDMSCAETKEQHAIPWEEDQRPDARGGVIE